MSKPALHSCRVATHMTSEKRVAANLHNRVRPRFFDQVGHENMYASSGNKHSQGFTKSCHRQTYQNYEQSREKLGTLALKK